MTGPRESVVLVPERLLRRVANRLWEPDGRGRYDALTNEVVDLLRERDQQRAFDAAWERFQDEYRTAWREESRGALDDVDREQAHYEAMRRGLEAAFAGTANETSEETARRHAGLGGMRLPG